MTFTNPAEAPAQGEVTLDAGTGTEEVAGELMKVLGHETIIAQIAWAALMSQDVCCCRKAFEDLMGNLMLLGPFLASLKDLPSRNKSPFEEPCNKGPSKSNCATPLEQVEKDDAGSADSPRDKSVGTKGNFINYVKNHLADVSSSMQRILEIAVLCKEPAFLAHLIIEGEELVKNLFTLGSEIGAHIDKIIQHIHECGVEVDGYGLKKAVNAAYLLQNAVYRMDQIDQNLLDSIQNLLRRYQCCTMSDKETCTSPDKPHELISELLSSSKRALVHTYDKDDAAFCAMSDKVRRGDVQDYKERVADKNRGDMAALRRPRNSLSAIWTRPQSMCAESLVCSPRVLWEVDTPSEAGAIDWLDDVTDFDEEICGAIASDMDICKGESATTSCEAPPASDPPPPQIVEIAPDDQKQACCIQKRVSFIPGQELGGRRRSSYLDGVESPARKSRRNSRRSYAAAKEDAPWEYLCPITRELMVDPVTLATGQTYDRCSCSKWIAEGHRTCPVTGLPISNTDLLPNFALRHAIQRWAAGHGIPLPEVLVFSPPRSSKSSGLITTEKLQKWGHQLSDPNSPAMLAVSSLFRGNIKDQETALSALCALAKDGGEEGRCSVAESGAIPALVFQLQNGSPTARAQAARCIRFLCRSSNPLITQAAASAVPFLATLLQQGTPDACEAAAGALVNLAAKSEAIKLSIAASGALPWLVRMLDSNDFHIQAQEVAAAALCNMAVNDDNRLEIARAGAIPLLIQVVKDCPTSEAGEYAAYALGSLACDNLEIANLMVQAAGVPVLVAMAGPGTPWAQEAAARALRNLSYHETVRPILCEAGAIQQLSALLDYSTPRASDAASAALSNLQLQSEGPHHPPVSAEESVDLENVHDFKLHSRGEDEKELVTKGR